MMRGIVFLISMLLTGCGEAPPPSLFASFVLTGSVNPRNTIASTQFLRLAKDLIFGVPALASSGMGSPSSAIVNFYRLYASTEDDCSSPILISDLGTLGLEKDLTYNPVLFTGYPSYDGYKCLAIEFDDQVAFRPDTEAINAWPGVCTDETMDYSADLYRNDDNLVWKNVSRNLITARGTQLAPIKDRVFVYASTFPTRVVNGAIGAQASQVFLLNKKLESPTSLVFYADFANHVSGSGSLCHLQNPMFGFR